MERQTDRQIDRFLISDWFTKLWSLRVPIFHTLWDGGPEKVLLPWLLDFGPWNHIMGYKRIKADFSSGFLLSW